MLFDPHHRDNGRGKNLSYLQEICIHNQNSNGELASKSSPKLITKAPGIDGTSIHLFW
jgi:hypothetical protein